MCRSQRVFVVVLATALSASLRFAIVQENEPTGALVLRFQQTLDLIEKEAILNRITHRRDSGRLLLSLAKATDDPDTRWLAIRGLGMLKFEDAAPFLMDSLQAKEHHVRANAARALGELGYSRAAPALIQQLGVEQDAGAIEQTSLALRMIKAQDAIPALKSRMSFDSAQTQCWLLGAIGEMGSKNDVPFIAQYLDAPLAAVPLCAAEAITSLTGENFGLSRSGGLFDPQAPVLKARIWWERAQKQYPPR
jgi:hypothetical protein